MGLDSQPFKRFLKRMTSSGSSQSSFGEHVRANSSDEVGTSRSASDACSDVSTTMPTSWYENTTGLMFRAVRGCIGLLGVALFSDDVCHMRDDVVECLTFGRATYGIGVLL